MRRRLGMLESVPNGAAECFSTATGLSSVLARQAVWQ